MHNSKSRLDLVAAVRRCRDLISENKYDRARTLGMEILARANACGFATGQAHWCLAIANDMLGEMEAAAEHATAAIEADPLAPEFEHSMAVIVDRIKAYLASDSRTWGDPKTPRLYAILVNGGWADAAAHLQMAKFTYEQGAVENALSLAEAVVMLNPRFVDALEFVGAVAEEVGKRNVAAEARTQAAAVKAGLGGYSSTSRVAEA